MSGTIIIAQISMSLKIFYICHLNDFLSFSLKPEVNTSLEIFIVRKWVDQAVFCLVKHVHMK